MVASIIKYIESVQTGGITTGGFGADFSADSLLNKHRPDLAHLPTTNGEHCTGDGLKMAMGISADTVDLEWVQVHPTGHVHPDEPVAKVKLESGVTATIDLGGNSLLDCVVFGRVTGAACAMKNSFAFCREIGQCTKDSYSYTSTEGTFKASSRNVEFAPESVTGYRDRVH